MNKKDILFILDRAHGKDVSGKQSPDGSFVEWVYSDKVVKSLIQEMNKLEIPNDVTVDDDYEIGLVNRVIKGNELSKETNKAVFITFHNNAGGGTGNELFIKRNPSDEEIDVANIMSKRLIYDFPEFKWRQHDPDLLYKEANYVVLAGSSKYNIKPDYTPIYLEFLFMDHPDDLKMLKDEKIFKRYIDSLLYGIVEICDYYGVGNFKIV
jgi:N-acetylmuramoyl-L-alanine amidase